MSTPAWSVEMIPTELTFPSTAVWCCGRTSWTGSPTRTVPALEPVTFVSATREVPPSITMAAVGGFVAPVSVEGAAVTGIPGLISTDLTMPEIGAVMRSFFRSSFWDCICASVWETLWASASVTTSTSR